MTEKRRPTIDSVQNVAATQWLALKTINYTDEDGIKRKWDVATRTTKRTGDKADAVVIVPVLRSTKNKKLDTILVKQYRPPLGRNTLEFPAGLIDDGETAEHAAIRELQEETGFKGTINEQFQSMLLCMSPGLTNESVQIMVVDVDLDDELNQSPKQNLDDGEAIVVVRTSLLNGLRQMMEQTSDMPIAFLYSFALGLDMGIKIGKKHIGT